MFGEMFTEAHHLENCCFESLVARCFASNISGLNYVLKILYENLAENVMQRKIKTQNLFKMPEFV